MKNAMTHEEYLEEFKLLFEKKLALTKRKNKDYAGDEDAFSNFELIEVLTKGRITAVDGMLVRITDKLARITNLLCQDAAVEDEKLEDTLDDLSIYADILNIYLKYRGNQEI